MQDKVLLLLGLLLIGASVMSIYPSNMEVTVYSLTGQLLTNGATRCVLNPEQEHTILNTDSNGVCRFENLETGQLYSIGVYCFGDPAIKTRFNFGALIGTMSRTVQIECGGCSAEEGQTYFNCYYGDVWAFRCGIPVEKYQECGTANCEDSTATTAKCGIIEVGECPRDQCSFVGECRNGYKCIEKICASNPSVTYTEAVYDSTCNQYVSTTTIRQTTTTIKSTTTIVSLPSTTTILYKSPTTTIPAIIPQRDLQKDLEKYGLLVAGIIIFGVFMFALAKKK